MIRKLHFTIFCIAIILIIIFLTTCSDHVLEEVQNNYYIPDSVLATPGPVPLSLISNHSRYIVIDTTGGYYLDQIRSIRNMGYEQYLILDSRGIFYIIDSMGKVQSAFSHIGRGPGEYIEIGDFTVNSDDQSIYVKTVQTRKIIHYNKHGKLMGEKVIDEFYVNGIQYFQNQLIGLSSFPVYLSYETSPKSIFIFDSDLKLISARDHPIWKENKSDYLYNVLWPVSSFAMETRLIFYEFNQNGRLFSLSPGPDWKIEEWKTIKMENNMPDDKIVSGNNTNSPNNPIPFEDVNVIESMVVTPQFLFLSVIHNSMFDIRGVLIDLRNDSILGVRDFAGYNRLWDDINGFYSFWPSGYLPETGELYFCQSPGKMKREYLESREINSKNFKAADTEILNIIEDAIRKGNPIIQLVTLN